MTRDLYRPEIDGMRAIAVISVLLSHTFPSILPGGFVGVDIFFVISGFLITRLIFKDLQEKSFSIWLFYQRRIRRIFPALCAVLMTCLVFGWVILTPAEYELFGTHLAASAGFVPNIIFWREAGYFDKEAITKPLLHLWSLGVEEQFYLVWPIILLIGYKLCSQNLTQLLGVCLLLCLGSLALSVSIMFSSPVTDFYSPLTRFWELGIGGCLALSISLNSQNCLKPTTNLPTNTINLLGLGSLIMAFWMINDQRVFPGLWALLPCIGTALIIFATNNHGSTQGIGIQQLLSSKVLVSLGLISYPLYLWHWPLLSFARILEGQAISVTSRLVIIALSLVLAWLTYQFLEKPIRRKGSKKVAIVLLLLILFLLAMGIVLRKQDGFKNRNLGLMQADPTTMVVGEHRKMIMRTCHISDQIPADLDCFEDVRDPVRYAILGDSKAEALFYGLTTVSSAQGRWLLIDGIHPPALNSVSQNAYLAKSQQAYSIIEKSPTIQVVAITSSLRGIFQIDKLKGFIQSQDNSEEEFKVYSALISRLEASGKKVIFVIDNPTFPDPTSCISGGLTSSQILNTVLSRQANPNCQYSYTEYLQGTKPYRDWVNRLQQVHPQLTVFDTAPILCNINENHCGTYEKNQFLYSYSDHISDYAAKKIGVILTPIVDNLVKTP